MPKNDVLQVEAEYTKETKKMFQYQLLENGSRDAVGSVYISKDNFENGEKPPDKIVVEISM